jgi:sugar phosphate permease
LTTDSATATDHAAVRTQPLGEALDSAPMSRFHVRFWLLAGLGILLDGFDFFIIGVANPLVAKDFAAGSAQQGLLSAAAIVGAMFGAALLETGSAVAGSSGWTCGCSSSSRCCAHSPGMSGR